MRILMRVLSFPFIAIIHLICVVLFYFKTMYRLARYGGESIIYDKNNNQKTINETYKMIEEKLREKDFEEYKKQWEDIINNR